MIYIYISIGLLAIFLTGALAIALRHCYSCYARWSSRRRRVVLLEELGRLNVYEWRDELSTNDTCAICRETFAHRNELRILNCNHGYHVYCIDNWIDCGNLFCPLCKRGIIPNAENYRPSDFHAMSDEHQPLLGPRLFEQRNILAGQRHVVQPMPPNPSNPDSSILRKASATSDLTRSAESPKTPANLTAAGVGNVDTHLKRAPKKATSSTSSVSPRIFPRDVMESFQTPTGIRDTSVTVHPDNAANLDIDVHRKN